ncbi:MAG: hypothetical protein NTW76_08900 [Corynebacteriales bacterium]|nr:hypothetical protein [Mycobacteriales bacterium]
MIAAVRSEWGKVWSVRTPGVWLAIAVVTGVLTTFSLGNDALLAITSGERGGPVSVDPVDVITPGVQVAQISLAAFAIHLVTPEYSSESMRVTVMASPRRWPILVAKAFDAVVTAGIVGGVVGCAMGVGVRLLLVDHIGVDASLAAITIGTASLSAVAAALGVALGFITRSAVPSLCIAIVLLVGSLAAPTSVGRLLPGPAGTDVMHQLSTGHLSSTGGAILCAWSTLSLVVAMGLLRRRDI